MKNFLSPIVIDLGRTAELRNTPSVNSKWTSCLEFAGADGVSVARSQVFSDRLVPEEALRSFVLCCHHEICLSSTVKSDAENGMKAGN
jgi:hypothetical protein